MRDDTNNTTENGYNVSFCKVYRMFVGTNHKRFADGCFDVHAFILVLHSSRFEKVHLFGDFIDHY